MPSALIVEQLTWVALAIMFVLAVIYGIVDKGKATSNRGVVFVTISGMLVVIALVLLAIGWQHGAIAYHLRYSYLNILPVVILLGYCLWEDIFREWLVFVVCVVAIIALWFVGYLFWIVWTIGGIIVFITSLIEQDSSASG